MSELDRFQKAHGTAWAGITQSPAFGAAFSIANLEKLDSIAALTNEEIEAHGKIILSGLRDHLLYETALLNLHQRKEFVFQEIKETYPRPEDEIAEEEQQQTQTGNEATSFNIQEFAPQPEPEPAEPPHQKRKYTRRKKRK